MTEETPKTIELPVKSVLQSKIVVLLLINMILSGGYAVYQLVFQPNFVLDWKVLGFTFVSAALSAAAAFIRAKMPDLITGLTFFDKDNPK